MHHSKGFTLIELMIVVAIVGILAALAWPNYMDYVRRSNRAEAKTEMLILAQRLQKCYSTYKRYDDPPGDDSCAVFDTLEAGNFVTEGGAFYTVIIEPLAPAEQRDSFILTAEADRAPQTEDTGCEIITLTHTGEREPIDCW